MSFQYIRSLSCFNVSSLTKPIRMPSRTKASGFSVGPCLLFLPLSTGSKVSYQNSSRQHHTRKFKPPEWPLSVMPNCKPHIIQNYGHRWVIYKATKLDHAKRVNVSLRFAFYRQHLFNFLSLLLIDEQSNTGPPCLLSFKCANKNHSSRWLCLFHPRTHFTHFIA